MAAEPDLWPSAQLDAPPMDWIEFPVPPQGDEQLRIMRVNTSFLWSNWTCIWGQGCPSILISGANSHVGCCQIGVHMHDEEFERVRDYVKQLGPDDADNYEDIQNRWYRPDKNDEDGYTRKTVTKDGGCILYNKPTGRAGSQGKLGCSLHHLAEKLGVHYSETKPDICWQIPVGYTEEMDDVRNTMTVTVTGTSGPHWGSARINGEGRLFPGFWCVETPEAYVAGTPVWKHMEYELRKLMGDEVYEVLVQKLQEHPRHNKMPGEAQTRPLIPLLVKERVALLRGGDKKDRAVLDKFDPAIIALGKEAK